MKYKIATWNVNGIRAVERKGDLHEYLLKSQPDILLIQEIKGVSSQFSEFLTSHPEYTQFYFSADKPGYAGTGIWVKKRDDILLGDFRTGMPDYHDDEGRISSIEVTLSGKKFNILSIYFPNGGKSSEAWDGKLIFFEKILDYINQIRDGGSHCIWGGDINCAHYEIDLARPKDNEGEIGFHPEERRRMDRWIEAGWLDIFRHRYPDTTDIYSWWHVITRARARNVGWRIDYLFADRNTEKLVNDISYLTTQMGSDHCPLEMELEV